MVHDTNQAQLVGEAVMEAVVAYNKANPSKKIHTLLVPDPAPLISMQLRYPTRQEPAKEAEKQDHMARIRRRYFTGLLKDFATNDGNRPVIEMSCNDADQEAIEKAIKDNRELKRVRIRTEELP
eukprot:GHVU01059981.1.p1 GENE.GHVU01059981.1~~GHVU01059981.1.p1  ORF type:complete len:124 (+),score=19.58 GHVU01059981.1:507-878(+)